MGLLSVISNALTPKKKDFLSTVSDNRSGGWWPLVRESFPGAWQQNIVLDRTTALTYYAIFGCITLIASDISKLRLRLLQDSGGDVWLPATNSAYSPVIRRPNKTQNRIQFWENWLLSKLIHGNTYVLKDRYNHGPVSDLWILDPNRVKPLIAENGDIYYSLQADNFVGLEGPIIVPSAEIIHDRWNCLFHPLCGISPLYASHLAATHGINIQKNSINFFSNNSAPGGILTAPGFIPKTEAEEMKARWEANFGGNNIGRIAVLGNGLTFDKVSITAVDAQLVDQARWTAEVICAVFHVPPYKIGLGVMPSYNNVQALNVEYFTQCLQVLIESAELCFDEGLEMSVGYDTKFDTDGLLRMDTPTQADVVSKLVHGGVYMPNDARAKFNLAKAAGGDHVYLQQQNY